MAAMSTSTVIFRGDVFRFGDAWYAPVTVIEAGMAENFTLQIPDRAQAPPDFAEFKARMRDIHERDQGAIEQLRECALHVEGLAFPVVGLQHGEYRWAA
jgi:hypothetical protein